MLESTAGIRISSHTIIWRKGWEVCTDATRFEWDDAKDALNQAKHGVAFTTARRAFIDPLRIMARDLDHSSAEERFYCFGKVEDGILTVRFTWRDKLIRIIGAGYWRKGKQIYERQNSLHE